MLSFIQTEIFLTLLDKISFVINEYSLYLRINKESCSDYSLPS